MKSSNLLLSIIIPTKDRFDYTKSSLLSLLEITDDSIEIIIHDNSQKKELSTWIDANIKDERVKYFHNNNSLTMIENYELALAHALGEYVTFIGDDDSVHKDICIAVRWAKDNSVDAIVPSSVVNYVWPDLVMSSKGSMSSGQLAVRPFSNNFLAVNCTDEIVKCCKSAGQNFHFLPKSYYGIVSINIFQEIKDRTGHFFPGVSPDMSSAISIACFANSVIFLDFPLFIPGSSAKSNAGLSGQKRHIGFLRDQSHLPSGIEDNWSDLIPCFYSVETIWAESVINALSNCKRNDLLKFFNFPLLYALCAVFHPKYLKVVDFSRFNRANKKFGNSLTLSYFLFSYYFIYWWLKRFYSLVLRFLGVKATDNSTSFSGLPDIKAASSKFHHFMKTKNFLLKFILK